MRGPQLNLQRDPRWGRNSNSPSEDPFHIGVYGQEIVLGKGDREAAAALL
jgi:beta-glucosidase-like glycosyl hydrolase